MSTTALAVCTFLMLTSSCTAQRGHMKALGGQRDPEGTVEEIDGFPSPEDFYDKYILPSKPVMEHVVNIASLHLRRDRC